MNWPVLEDNKTMLGFILSLLCGFIAIVLAINNNNYWVVFGVISLIMTAFSVKRADKIYKQNQ